MDEIGLSESEQEAIFSGNISTLLGLRQAA
jgi:hypothetical protein